MPLYPLCVVLSWHRVRMALVLYQVVLSRQWYYLLSVPSCIIVDLSFICLCIVGIVFAIVFGIVVCIKFGINVGVVFGLVCGFVLAFGFDVILFLQCYCICSV